MYSHRRCSKGTFHYKQGRHSKILSMLRCSLNYEPATNIRICSSWRLTTASLMIEKRKISAYSIFKTFFFGFKGYFNFIIVEFWSVVLLDWTAIFWNTVLSYSAAFSHSKPIFNFQMVKHFLLLVSCSRSTSCCFECVCNFVLTDCFNFEVCQKIKMVSRFVTLLLPVEIVKLVWYFSICSEVCSY